MPFTLDFCIIYAIFFVHKLSLALPFGLDKRSKEDKNKIPGKNKPHEMITNLPMFIGILCGLPTT